MTTLTEAIHATESFISEAPGSQSHEAITVKSGQNLKSCAVLGTIVSGTVDARGRNYDTSTSSLLAGLKVFGDTLPRSFSSPALLGKWIMWVVLIVHLFIPLLFILLLFVHLLRVSRAKLFPPRKLTFAFLGVLVLYTLVFPINMVGKAEAERRDEAHALFLRP